MMRRDFRDLVNRFLEADFYGADYSACIDWAIDKLSKGRESEDIDILAGLGKDDHREIRKYIERIISEEIPTDPSSLQTWAGQAICRMSDEHKSGSMSLSQLDERIGPLYRGLGYPDWLAMLARNCEYATDIDAFIRPFEDEFQYIAGLWRTCDDLGEFLEKYSREISNSHDLEGLKKS